MTLTLNRLSAGNKRWNGSAAMGNPAGRFNGSAAVSNRRNQLTEYLRLIGNTAAWYQPGIGVTGTLNASAWANQMGAAGALEQATGANQPIVLSFSGSKYVYQPAAANNWMTSPNKIVTGDQTITLDIALNDYTPAADVILADTLNAADGFRIMWLSGDKVRFRVGNGIDTADIDAPTTSGFTDGTRHTVTIVWEDGVGATFYYDGVISGSQVAAARTLTNGVISLVCGGTLFLGKMYRLQLGSLYDFNAADWPETTANGATQVSSTTGETWTLNNTGAKPAQIVASPQLLFDGTDDFMADTFTLAQPVTAYLVGKQITWTDNDLILDGATADTLGLKQTTTTPSISINAGLEVAENDEWTLGANAIITAQLNGASSLLQVNAGTATTGDAGAGDPSGLTLGAVVTPGSYGNFQIKELIIRSAADSAATRAVIQTYLNQIHHIY